MIVKGYAGNIIKCLAEKEINVKVGNQVGKLLIRVVKGPSLLGCDMSKFTLPWQEIFNVVSAR